MLLHGGFHNRQTQPRAARFTVTRLVGTVERTENLFAVFRAYPRTIVINDMVIPSLSTEKATSIFVCE